MSDKPYKLELTFTQSTGDKEDNETLSREYSVDPNIHAIKTEVWTRHITQALAAITKELTDMAIAVNSGSPGKSGK